MEVQQRPSVGNDDHARKRVPSAHAMSASTASCVSGRRSSGRRSCSPEGRTTITRTSAPSGSFTEDGTTILPFLTTPVVSTDAGSGMPAGSPWLTIGAYHRTDERHVGRTENSRSNGQAPVRGGPEAQHFRAPSSPPSRVTDVHASRSPHIIDFVKFFRHSRTKAPSPIRDRPSSLEFAPHRCMAVALAPPQRFRQPLGRFSDHLEAAHDRMLRLLDPRAVRSPKERTAHPPWRPASARAALSTRSRRRCT